MTTLSPRDSAAMPVAIAPGDKRIRLIGRFDQRDPARFRFAWAGSSLTFRYAGKSVNLLMEDECGGGANPHGGNTNNYFTITLDDRQPLELSLEKDRTVYRIGEDLKDGIHTVTVFRRNCPRIGAVNFLGLQLASKNSLCEPPPKRQRCIEVIGDSISVGYGIMGKDGASPATPVTENCYLSYGAITARALDADLVCIAWSGFGVYRDVKGAPEYVMGKLYELTVPLDPAPADIARWDFAGYTPDVVVINLGTNDFEKGHPDKQGFNAAYRALMEMAWKHAPKAHIFCTTSPMMTGDQVDATVVYLTDLIADLAKEGKANVHLLRFPLQNTIPDGVGGNWHPGVATHRVMAELLIADIKKALNW